MIGLAVFLISAGAVFLAVLGYLFVQIWRDIGEQKKLIDIQIKLHREQAKGVQKARLLAAPDVFRQLWMLGQQPEQRPRGAGDRIGPGDPRPHRTLRRVEHLCESPHVAGCAGFRGFEDQVAHHSTTT